MIHKNLSRKGMFAFVILSSACLLFSSCKKDDLPVDQTPVAGLMAYNLAADQPAINVRLSGSLLPTGSLAYPAYTGNYLNIYAGSRAVETIGSSSKTLDTLTYNFAANKYYSLFVIGANNSYKNIVVLDNYDSLTASSGKAYVRYINALSNATSSNVSIQTASGATINATAAFGQVSNFMAVDPGNITVNVSNEGVTGVNRTIAVEGQKAYILLLTGLPNQSDSAKTVQIRYVVNGSIRD